MLKLSLIALAVCFAAPAQNFTYPAFLTPGYLVAGSTTRAINIFNQGYSQAENLTALWNGSPRTTIKMGLGGYTIQLTDADLAASQLAEIQMRDSASGALVDLTYCLIVLGVKPTGIAFDPTRNLAYLATPQQTADSRFPPNSVVAFDPASGKAGTVLTFGGVPGNLALSSDATVLCGSQAAGQKPRPHMGTRVSSRFVGRRPIATERKLCRTLPQSARKLSGMRRPRTRPVPRPAWSLTRVEDGLLF